jgi:hypothetical protein
MTIAHALLFLIGSLVTPPGAFPADATHGTRVTWEANPLAAFKRAAREDRPVFVLHVSGNFEQPRET